MRRLTGVLILLGLLAPTAALADGRGVISRNGRVGSLTMGVSTEASVRAFAGRPNDVRSGIGEGNVTFRVLRFRCGSSCNSFFYLDANGRLANFLTRSKRYRTAGGTRVGDAEEEAERQERKAARSQGCADFYGIVRTGKAELYVNMKQSSGRVVALAVAGRNSVLGC